MPFTGSFAMIVRFESLEAYTIHLRFSIFDRDKISR